MEKSDKKRKKRRGTVVRLVLCLIFLGCMVVGGWMLYSRWIPYAESREVNEEQVDRYVTVLPTQPAVEETPANPEASEEVVQAETAPISVSFDALLADCADVVGWLYCEGTPLNYPVVQSYDNDYYLRRLMNGKYNIAGTIFMDYRNSAHMTDWNTIIYGHYMKDGTMFGLLPKYREQAYYDAHPVLYYLTPNGDYKIEVVAGCVIPADSDLYTIPTTVEGRDALLEKALAQSTFVSDVEIGEEDRLVTLSTCVYDYENARYVLIGVLRALGDPQSVDGN